MLKNHFFFNTTYLNYKSNLISKNEYKNNKGEINIFYLFQISSEKPLKKITITIKKIKNGIPYDINTNIINANNSEYYFQLNNLEYDSYDDFILLDINVILSEYLDYFCKKNIGENIQKCLIKAMINKITNEKNIRIASNNFFRILKQCIKFEIETKNLENLQLRQRKMINSEYYITEEEIKKIEIISKQKSKIINLIVIVYLNSDPKYLFKLINGDIGPSICRNILDLINEGTIKAEKLLLMCNDNEEINLFQKLLLYNANNKNDFENIVNINKGLTNSLTFIKNNIDFLIENNFFPVKLDIPTDKDDINELFILIRNIMNNCSEIKYSIINIEEIFDDLCNLYLYKDLDELCKLNIFLPFINESKKGQILINNFYKNIHTKGLNLIKNKQLTTTKIFDFILSQDVYYYKQIFSKSKYRDPEIFKYISITKNNKDDDEYLKNLDIIKNNRLYLLFSDCGYEVQKTFQKILLAQVKTINDLKSIFYIFPRKYIDQGFTLFINAKIDELKYSIIEEMKENEQILFEILDEWLWINYENKFDLNNNLNILEFNYDFTSKYYLHLFKAKSMKIIFNIIKGNILKFSLNQYNEQKASAESFIFLLLNPLDEKFFLNINEKMNELILSKNDFYQKEENLKYKLFKLFIENSDYLCKNPKISEGKYYKEIYEFKNIIINEILKNDLVFEVINNLIEEDEFNNRIKFIFGNDKKDLNIIFFGLKLGVELCRRKFEKFEKFNDYLKTFFSNSKKNEIELLNNKLKELKKKKVSELIISDKFFENNEIYNFDNLLQDSIKIRYKNSDFFMNIYIKKKNNEYPEKTEEQILNDSIEEYRNACKEIILQRDNKESLFEVNNLKEFFKETKIETDDMMKKEIRLMLEELQI